MSKIYQIRLEASRMYKALSLLAIALLLTLTTFGQTRSYEQEDVIKVSGVTTPAQVNALSQANKQTTRTYLDGQGRPIQVIAVQGSAVSNYDIVQPITYNALGQQVKNYLPYVGSDGTGSYRANAVTEQGTFYSNGAGDNVADDTAPYSQKIFEGSPLQRLLQAGNVGAGFQPASGQHYKTISTRSNNATSDGNIIQYNPDGSVYGNYPANSLNVTDMTDEDGKRTLLYEDILGNTILKRLKNGSANSDTYYVYNIAGNISCIIPPLLVSGTSLSTTAKNNLMFRYVYDSKGRLIEKYIPALGAQGTYIVYDPLNRPVLVQDGNLRAANKWYYIKYDINDHPISHGIYTDATRTTRAAMQTYVDGLTGYATNWYEGRNTVSTTNYYTNVIFPTTGIEPLAYSYYDDYDRDFNGTQDYTYQAQSLTGEATPSLLTRGMLTMMLKRTVGQGLSNIWLSDVFFYDKRGLLIQTRSNNQLNYTQFAVTDNTTTVYDFNGKVKENQVKQVTATTKTILTRFNYGSNNKNLTSIDQKYNAQEQITIAAYTYNELGQLIKKDLHSSNSDPVAGDDIVLGASDAVSSGQTKSVIANKSIVMQDGFIAASGSNFSAKINTGYLQSVDYRYNIRGQMTGINDSKLSTLDNDLFGMTLLYDTVDPNITNTPSYTGQISAVKWMSRNGSNSKTNERSYRYSYDALNRITSAVYAERVITGTGAFNVNANGFNENGITYDDNSNIKTLKRNTSTVGGTSFTEADNLTYTYEPDNPNQLKGITDGAGANYTGFGFRNLTGSTGFYQYDANGNLKTDPYKGLTTTYNNLNKTDKITITTVTGRYIDYTYGADGTVLRKRVYDNNILQSTTDYIGGLVYENTALNYFSMPEGRVVSSGTTLQPEYVITDNQGNARFSFKDNGSGGVQILQENSYYAFGKTMPGSTVGLPTNPNRNLYNGGSEWQNMFSDLPDYYQTYYRNYDPAIGRFIGIDPEPESAESMSTYQYSMNNPVIFNDPMGDKPERKNEPNILWEGWLGPVGGGGGGGGRIGPGSGNYWSDGIRYSDWSGYGGSQMYRDGLAAGMRDIGGLLYNFYSDGSRNPYIVNNGLAGYWTQSDYNTPRGETFVDLDETGFIKTFHPVANEEGNPLFGTTLTTQAALTKGNSASFIGKYLLELRYTQYTGIVNDKLKGTLNFNTTIRNRDVDRDISIDIGKFSFSMNLTSRSIGYNGYSFNFNASLIDGMTYGVSHTNSSGNISGSEFTINPFKIIPAAAAVVYSTAPYWLPVLAL